MVEPIQPCLVQYMACDQTTYLVCGSAQQMGHLSHNRQDFLSSASSPVTMWRNLYWKRWGCCHCHCCKNPTKVVANFLVLVSKYPQFSALEPMAPKDRTYLEYPPELVWIDTVQRLSPSWVIAKDFVFKHNWIRTGKGGICVRMTIIISVSCILGKYTQVTLLLVSNHFLTTIPTQNMLVTTLFDFCRLYPMN
jgi:hypothetical protein